ncbi:MAG: T9SS type A sorting domain-containing protein [Calditrichia bacterium]
MKIQGSSLKLSCTVMLVFFHLSAILLFSQQVNIPRIDLMPDMPDSNRYIMRDWRRVALDYDSLVFDLNRTGDYLPLIWLNYHPVNYPGHNSFGLHTVVGTNALESSEAINVLPAVISASLAGIDKSIQNGYNWVLMCEEYFNKANGAGVYLNHPTGSNWDDWWYDTMPNLFFYQLYSLYPNIGDFAAQFISVADRWESALRKMNGSTTPWAVPYMNYRAFDLMKMTPLAADPREPEAAGALGWMLYNAFAETGNPEYRIGAEWCLEFLSNWSTNPSYELQLPYGACAAARMNAELGTAYNVEKLVNWCFTTSGNVRDWGAIVGNWGGYDCSGLIGEVSSNDYAFIMNTFEQAGALVPMVRYDERFAAAIGKWMLNAAAAARLFYTNYLPDVNQDSEEWSHLYDPRSAIAHEALHKYNPSNLSVTPYATGDAIRGNWGETNLALYGSSHVGIFAGIIDTTNIPMILRLDLLKTDYFRQAAYPTYLYYNPYETEKTVNMEIAEGPCDIYDAVTNAFLETGANTATSIVVPAKGAVVAVLTPAGGNISYDLDKTLVDDVVIDFHSGRIVANYPPRIKSLSAKKKQVIFNENLNIYCTASDRDQTNLTFSWNISGGALQGEGSNVVWTAPDTAGSYSISCIVEDGMGGRDSSNISVEVVEAINHEPVITSLSARPRKLDLGSGSRLSCLADDPDGDTLRYAWRASAGMLADSGSVATWTAPSAEGNYYITCSITDGKGGQVTDSIGIEVRDFSDVQTGSLVAWYPFDGNANDGSGNEHNGIVHGAVLTGDREGNPASAYYFDGINDYISVPYDDSLNFQNSISICFWMNIGSFFDREAYPISHGNWENRWKISLIPEKRLRWTINTTAGIKDLDSETILSVGSWYFVTAVYNGNDIEVYLNGELDSFSSWSGLIFPADINLTIGQVLPDNHNYNFKGILDDIRIYNYALSVPEIQALYLGNTSIDKGENQFLPQNFVLEQNYPNPFNPVTTIGFWTPRSGQVSLKVYDLTGREVVTLKEGKFPAGRHEVRWNAGDMASGIYFYRLEAGEFRQTKKLILIR